MKVSAVSYLNTKPFLVGLEKTGLLQKLDLSLDIPSQTAQKLLQQEVDLALVPVAVLPQISANYQIISDFCIGAVGKVRTVGVYSQVPLSQVQQIYLDYHSRTSVQLVQVLCHDYWGIPVNFIPAKQGYEQKISNYTAGLIIGDRAIQYRSTFNYEYDLSEAWQQFTSLPFVFAVWIGSKKLPAEFEAQLNHAFANGLQHIPAIARQYEKNNSLYRQFGLYEYLSENISYRLDAEKRQALQLFLKYLVQNTIKKQFTYQ